MLKQTECLKLMLLAIFLFNCMGLIQSHAASTTWIGAEGGNWSNNTNWNGGEPSTYDDAVLDNGNTAIINQSGEKCSNLKMGIGTGKIGKLDMQGGDLTTYGITLGTGSISITNGATLTSNGDNNRFGQDKSVASVSISNGGHLNTTKLDRFSYVGYNSTTPGVCSFSVDGTDSTWTTNYAYIYSSTLSITNGGQVIFNSGCDLYSSSASYSSTITVDGINSKITGQGSISVRDYSTLSVRNGGQVSSKGIGISSHSNAGGTASVDGQNSKITTSALYVGDSASIGDSKGSLTISNGGEVLCNGDYCMLGNGTGAKGTVIVDGTNSKLTVDKFFYIGYMGTGELSISNGGQVISKNGYAGYGSYYGKCMVTIDGIGSKWVNSGYIEFDYASLEVTHGGQLISNGCGFMKSATISDAGSTCLISKLDMYGSSENILNINDAGQLIVTGTLNMLNLSGPICSININRGTLTTGEITGKTGSISITDPVGGTALTVGSSIDSSFAGSISDYMGSGSLKKIGISTLTLSGSNTYTGSTLITAGKLALSGSGTLASSLINVDSGAIFDVSALSSGYSLGSSQTLKGTGTIIGNLTINGIHAPGNSPGIETILGNYNMQGQLNIELAGATEGTGYDQVLVSGMTSIFNATLSGSLLLDWTSMNGSMDTTQLWILKNDTAGILSGEFSNYANGASLGNHDGRDWYLWYGADAFTGSLTGGNDVVITAVPEPAGIVLLGIAVAGLVLASRRRRKT